MLSFYIGSPENTAAQGLWLSADNRWVRYACTLPWDELRQIYPDLLSDFCNEYDDPLRTALACRLIQTQYIVSQDELLLMVQENPYMQYFCGFTTFDPVHNRLSPELLQQFSQIPENIFLDIIELCSRRLPK